jgi:hypothetical protein
MADFKQLISANDLKTDRLSQAGKSSVQRPFSIRYHDRLDALIVFLVPSEHDAVVFYLDEHVGLLCDSETLEIVGLQVEAFERSFLPKYAGLSRAWRLSDQGTEFENFGQLTLRVQSMEPDVAREVVEASKPFLGQLGQRGEDLIAALA